MVSMRLHLLGGRGMTKEMSGGLNSVDFAPKRGLGLVCRDVDRFGRRLYRPVVEGLMGGRSVRILPMELGCELTEKAAAESAAHWAQVV